MHDAFALSTMHPPMHGFPRKGWTATLYAPSSRRANSFPVLRAKDSASLIVLKDDAILSGQKRIGGGPDKGLAGVHPLDDKRNDGIPLDKYIWVYYQISYAKQTREF